MSPAPPYYPLHLNLSERLCVVVGGGKVAERRVQDLLEAQAKVRVISPALTPLLTQLSIQNRIEASLKPYEIGDLTDAFLVFSLTNDRTVNAQITSHAHAMGILVNVADSPREGDFIIPSVVRRGDLCIGITTGGQNPTLSRHLTQEMEARFGEEYGAFVELLGELREVIKREFEALERGAAYQHLFQKEVEICTLLRNGDHESARELALQAIQGKGYRVQGTEEPIVP